MTKHKPYELKILVKYFKSQGYKPTKRKEMIYAFCEKHIENFSRARYFRIINKALNYGIKKHNNLVVIDSVNIIKEELDYIIALDIEYNLKKVLFTLLVQNKINKKICEISFGKASEFNFFGGTKEKFKEIKECAKIPQSLDINKVVNILGNKNIIEIKSRGKIDLSYIYKIESGDNVAFKITTFDDIGYYFDYYCGENKVIKCECGRFIKKNNNKQKYCGMCAKEKQLEYQKQSMKKIRENM